MLLAAVLVLFGITHRYSASAEEQPARKDPDGSWYFQKNNNAPEEISPDKEGTVSVSCELPENVTIFFERDRKTFRPRQEDFQKENLSMEVRVECADGRPVRGNIFIKDKDGLWFQSRNVFVLSPGVWHEVGVDLKSSSYDLVPEGHTASWSCLNAATIFARGFTLFSQENRSVRFSCRNLRLSGERKKK